MLPRALRWLGSSLGTLEEPVPIAQTTTDRDRVWPDSPNGDPLAAFQHTLNARQRLGSTNGWLVGGALFMFLLAIKGKNCIVTPICNVFLVGCELHSRGVAAIAFFLSLYLHYLSPPL